MLLAIAALPACAAPLPLTIPIDVDNGKVYVRVAINEATPSWFVLDSGAGSSVIDTGVARALGLHTEGSAQVTGAGQGGVPTTFTPNVTYRVSGAEVVAPRSYVIDLSSQRTLVGREVSGILGYDLFARYVVALDFESRTMTLFDPATFSPDGWGEAIPITFDRHWPKIPIRIKINGHDTVERSILVDLGSSDGVDDDVLANAPNRLEIVGGVGLGQEFRTVLARAEWVELGSHRLAGVPGATGGIPLVGMEVLRRFDLVFDYSHSRLFLRPNRFFAEPFAIDASGIDLRVNDAFTEFPVHDVAADSPAARAGLAGGDVIVAIDNQPASAFTIGQVQTLLARDGRTLLLDVRRNGSVRRLPLTMRRRL